MDSTNWTYWVIKRKKEDMELGGGGKLSEWTPEELWVNRIAKYNS